jgi:hypothetical protein
MTATTNDPLRRILAAALLAFPGIFILVSLLHFRHPSDLLHFRSHYVTPTPDHYERQVAMLIAARNRWPMIHDPHMIAYLSLPVIPLCAFALYLLGRRKRPLASAIAMMITITGAIYTGGVFGMWTAFFRGISLVDPSQQAGATATFIALTTPQGAFLLTTTLAKLTMLGLAAQALTLIGVPRVRTWAIVCIVSGSLMFLVFWDLDNWMMIGTLLLLAGFVPMRTVLLQEETA